MSEFNQHKEHETLASALLGLRHSLEALGPIDPEELRQALSRENRRIGLLSDSSGQLQEITEAIEHLAKSRDEYLASLKEMERSPLAHEPARITDQDILVVTKFSKVEWDMRERKVTLPTLLEQYEKEGVEIDRILASHIHQQDALQELHRSIPNARFIDRDQAENDPSLLQNFSLIIAFGGDDNLKFVSQMVQDGFLLGINSDPRNSEGALTSDTVESFPRTLRKLESGEFKIQEWPRLQISVNGTTLPPACSEIYIGDRENIYTARARATLGDTEFPIKGSGMIIANGAGSTGWFRAASLFLFFGEHTWRRTIPHAEFVSREPYGSSEQLSIKNLHGALAPGEVLEITSSSNHNPVVSVDSVVTVPFPRGMTARVRFSDSPLKVIVGSR